MWTLGRYAEAGVTQMSLEPNFQPGGGELARVLLQMEALAPSRLHGQPGLVYL